MRSRISWQLRPGLYWEGNYLGRYVEILASVPEGWNVLTAKETGKGSCVESWGYGYSFCKGLVLSR